MPTMEATDPKNPTFVQRPSRQYRCWRESDRFGGCLGGADIALEAVPSLRRLVKAKRVQLDYAASESGAGGGRSAP